MKKTLLTVPSKLSSFYIKTLLVHLLCIGFSTVTYSQVATSYNFSQVDTGLTYTPITGGTVFASGAFTNTAPASVALGFTFNFNGTNYTNVTITDNGYVTFGSTLPTSTNYTPISNTATYDGAIAAFGGQNLQAASTNLNYTSPPLSFVRYETLTISGQKVFVLQYENVVRRTSLNVNINGLINMQIRLYETTNVIETVYNTFNPSSPVTAGSAAGQIGLRGADRTDFNNRVAGTGDWTGTIAGAANTNTMTLNSALYNTGVTKFIWTPCFSPTSITAAVLADNTTGSISWTAPLLAPTGGYDYEVRTAGVPGSGATGLFAFGNTTATSVLVPGLQTGITYSIYVKSNCRNLWLPVNTFPSSVTVTPTCPIATIPYTQNFESTIAPAIPNCNSVVTPTGAAFVTIDNTSTPLFGFNNKNLITSGNLLQDAWYFTQAIDFPAAGDYRLSYKYGGTREQAFFQQRMRVFYGSEASVAGMTTQLADHPNIKESPLTNIINFTVASAGTYYIGFYGYAKATNGSLQLDDIVVETSTCRPPSGLIAGQIASSTALIAWTAQASATTGYQYYVAPAAGAIANAGTFSIGQTYQIKTIGTTNFTLIGAASNTVGLNFVATGVGSGTGTAQLMIIPPATPLSTVVATGNVGPGVTIANLSGLTPSTIYNFWVSSNCGGGDYSQWSTGGTFTTKPVVVYCAPSGAGFSQDPRGITNVTMGSINNTTGIETNNYGDYSSLTTNVSQTSTVNVSITNATGFTYDTAIWVDWNNDGDFTDTGESVYTGVMPAPNPSVLNASFVVPTLDSDGNSTLGPHRVRIGAIDSPTFTGGALTPCRTGQYQAYEDYSLFVITSPPPLTISAATATICEGFSTTIPVTVTSTVSDFQVYTWSPSIGVSGNIGSGYTFNPTATTTYTLTATQTSGNFSSNTATFIVTVNARPTPITVTPSSTTYCNGGPAQALVATGGVVPGVFNTVFEENFNDPTNTFTTVNNSTGGTVGPAAAAWTLYASGIVNSTGLSFTSNDSSQYYLSNSDAQGSGGITRTELISPSFSLVGYVDASLSFWHQFDYLDSPANVEISTDDGANWLPTPLASYISDQGSPNNFANAILNLTPYVGMTNLKIRFRYVNATWDWEWAIDNVKVFGSGTSIILWSPTTELYTDAAATIPYSGTALSTVYSKPTTTRVYTASSTSPSGCSTNSNPVTISYSSVNGGIASSDQNSCSGIAANLTVTGHVGSVTKWQYCPNANFLPIGSVVDIPSSNSETLTSAQMSFLTANRYYRAVVNSGACIGYSSVVAITIVKTVWNGTSWTNGEPDGTKLVEFQGNFTSAGDMAACSVLVTSGNVIFNVGHTLTVQNTVQVAGGSLTFENQSSLYQVLDVTNGAGVFSGGNAGNITYKRATTPVFRFDYTYWSTPVNPQNLLAVSPLSPTSLFYEYNSATNNWQNVNPASTTMIPSKGYIFRAPLNYPFGFPDTPQEFTASFTGVPNNGTITLPVSGGASQLNLLGNPYPSAINADTFLLDPANAATLNGTIYLWTHNTPITNNNYSGSDYAIYNYMGGTVGGVPTGPASNPGINSSIPNGKIASGQGFFIKGLSNGVATFKNSMRIAGNNNQFFRMSSNVSEARSPQKNRYWLDIFNTQGAFKQVLVGYVDDATLGIDRLYDGEMVDIGSVISFYTMASDTKLTIQGRPTFTETDEVLLGFKSTLAGSYTIRLSMFDGLFETKNVYLEDTLLGVIHSLRQSDYTFSTEMGTFDTRFVLRYTTEALGTTNPAFNENSVIVYKNDQGLYIDSGAVNMATVSIFDIRGRLLATQKQVNRTTTVFTTLPTTNQVLLVRIEAEDGAIVTKKVVY